MQAKSIPFLIFFAVSRRTSPCVRLYAGRAPLRLTENCQALKFCTRKCSPGKITTVEKIGILSKKVDIFYVTPCFYTPNFSTVETACGKVCGECGKLNVFNSYFACQQFCRFPRFRSFRTVILPRPFGSKRVTSPPTVKKWKRKWDENVPKGVKIGCQIFVHPPAVQKSLCNAPKFFIGIIFRRMEILELPSILGGTPCRVK